MTPVNTHNEKSHLKSQCKQAYINQMSVMERLLIVPL